MQYLLEIYIWVNKYFVTYFCISTYWSLDALHGCQATWEKRAQMNELDSLASESPALVSNITALSIITPTRDISGSQGDDVNVIVLGCFAMWTFRLIPTFRRNILTLNSWLNWPEDGISMFIRNVGISPQVHTALLPKNQHQHTTVPLEISEF